MAYVIQPGDTLTKIAKKYNTTVGELLSLNNHVVNPDVIRSGASLNVPNPSLSPTPAPAAPLAPSTPAPDTRSLLSMSGVPTTTMTTTPFSAPISSPPTTSGNGGRSWGGANLTPGTSPAPAPVTRTLPPTPAPSYSPSPTASSISSGSMGQVYGSGGGNGSPGAPGVSSSSSTSSSTSSGQDMNSLINQTIMAMLKAGQGAGNEDLQAKRNAIIQARFNSNRNPTPEELRVLSPDAQASLRNLDTRGLETQLGGVDAALKARVSQQNADMENKRAALTFLQNSQKSDKTNDLLTPTEAASLGVPYGTTVGEAAVMGITPKANLSVQDKTDLELKLNKQYTTSSKEYKEAERQLKIINTAYDGAVKAAKAGTSLNAATQGVLIAFNKLLDPTSVVRETEYARTPEGQSLLNQLDGKLTQLKQGGAGLTAQSLKEFVDMGNEFLKGYQTSQNETIDLIKTQAKNYGLNVENIISAGDLGRYGDSGGSSGSGQDDPLGIRPSNDLSKSQNGSVSFRNNNPLNIKYGNFAMAYGAEPSTKATDGGQFAKFPDVATGLQAAKDLLTASSYASLPLDQAMKRWSGNGYGADVAPASLRGKTTGQMTDAELNLLIESMKKREGWVPNNLA